MRQFASQEPLNRIGCRVNVKRLIDFFSTATSRWANSKFLQLIIFSVGNAAGMDGMEDDIFGTNGW